MHTSSSMEVPGCIKLEKRHRTLTCLTTNVRYMNPWRNVSHHPIHSISALLYAAYNCYAPTLMYRHIIPTCRCPQ